MTRLDDGLDGVDGRTLMISVVLIVLSLVTSRLVKHRPVGDVQPLGE